MAKLVAIGDSITQGFQSLAISSTDLSPPALIAERMGLDDLSFRTPDFSGAGGLPFNLEWMARKLQASYGPDIRRFEWITAAFEIGSLIDQVEDYWERGRGSEKIQDVDYHNLAVWGFEVGDAYNMTPKLCRQQIGKTRDNLLQIPSKPRLRSAARVLNPGQLETRDVYTQITIAKRIREDDQIEHLILALGANNVLGTVVDLKIKETGEDPPGPNSDRNLWSPAAFREEFRILAEQVAQIGADNVCIATVPHITIPPITRGVMENLRPLPDRETYFDFYTRFWIRDDRFNKDRDPHLTKRQAITIDDHIDRYNEVIIETAEAQGWKVVHLCKLLDEIAFRRNHQTPPRPLPPPIRDLTTELFRIHPNGQIRSGGLFSLDGVHPTTCGHGLIADEYIKVLREADPSIPRIDFAELAAGTPWSRILPWCSMTSWGC